MISEDDIERFSRSRYEPEWLLNLRKLNLRKFQMFREKKISDSPIERSYTKVDETFIEEAMENGTGGSFREEGEYFVIDYTSGGEMDVKSSSLKYTVLRSMQNALVDFKEDIIKSMENPRDEWSALSNALWSTGVFLKVPSDRRCERVIKFRVIYPSKPLIKKDVFIIGSNSHMQFVEYSQVKDGFRGLEETYLDIGKNSTLKHLTMIDGNNSQIISIKNSSLGNDSNDEWYYALKNLKNGIVVTNSVLRGENSSIIHRGALIGKAYEHYDVGTNIYHTGKGTRSDSNVRAALKDFSRSVIRGRIHISSESRESNAYFSGNSLLLSENAKSNALPFLEIEGDGAQARHSATITNLDYDQLFYAQTRGLDERESRNIIVEGFLDPVVRQILIYEGTRYLIFND
jgi:Fe-S cluster assembly scaffold protein SufB